MDKYNDIIKINEEDFQKDCWGLGFLLKSFFFNKDSGEIKIIFPDNIDEILLNLIKSPNLTKLPINHAMFYTKLFTMHDGHICKNPTIKLLEKKLRTTFADTKRDEDSINMNLAFLNPELKDLKTITLDAIEYVLTVEVILDENLSNKIYTFLVYDIVDPTYSKINVIECCNNALTSYHGYVEDRSLGHMYDGYNLSMEPTIQIIDENPDYLVVKSGKRCHRIWINDNNDISMIQEIGGASYVEYDKILKIDEFFEKYPNLKNDWEDVI